MALRLADRRLWALGAAVQVRRVIRRWIWSAARRLSRRGPALAVLSGTPKSLSQVDWTHAEPRDLVVRSEQTVVVEPKYGWAMARPATLIDVSLTHGWTTYSKTGRAWVGLPSLWRFLYGRWKADGGRRLEAAMSLTSPWPENYYHFLVDVLPKLVQFERVGVDPALPVLVSTALPSFRFFTQAVSRGELARRTFRPSAPGEYLAVDRLYFAQGSPFDRSTIARLNALLGVAPPATAPTRRVFLNRTSASGRCLENLATLQPILQRVGFETVFTEDLDFDAQVALFQQTRYLVAIHGAGMINMIFATPGAMSILELVPRAAEPEFDCFRTLAAELEFEFVRLLGVTEPYAHKRANFSVDPGAFGDAVAALTATVAPEREPARE